MLALSKLQLEITNRQKDIDRIVKDQDRLRENMKALRGTPEEKALLQRYTSNSTSEKRKSPRCAKISKPPKLNATRLTSSYSP